MEVFVLFYEYISILTDSESRHGHQMHEHEDKAHKETYKDKAETTPERLGKRFIIDVVDQIEGTKAHGKEHDHESELYIERICNGLKSMAASSPLADYRLQAASCRILVHDE